MSVDVEAGSNLGVVTRTILVEAIKHCRDGADLMNIAESFVASAIFNVARPGRESIERIRDEFIERIDAAVDDAISKIERGELKQPSAALN